MNEKTNKICKFKSFAKKVLKFCFYSILFSTIFYFTTWAIAYLMIENHKMDIDDVMSLEHLEEDASK